MKGIIFYKNYHGEKIPIDYVTNCEFLLNEAERNKQREVYSLSAEGIKSTDKERKLLDKYEKRILYLWVEGIEFIIKND